MRRTATVTALAAVALTTPAAAAATEAVGGGADVGTVADCAFPGPSDSFNQGTGLVVSTPSGVVVVACTGAPLRSDPVPR